MAKFRITDNKITVNTLIRNKRTVLQCKLFRGHGDKLTATYQRLLITEAKQYAKDNAGFTFKNAVTQFKRVGLINNAILENKDFQALVANERSTDAVSVYFKHGIRV